MGLYDVPAMIDYICNHTKVQNVSYMGHSMGATEVFMAASLIPEYYNEKVNLFVGLAPIVKLDHCTQIAMVVYSKLSGILGTMFQLLGIYDYVSMGYETRQINGMTCKLLPKYCVLVEEGFFDLGEDIDNLDREAEIYAHTGVGSGWRNLVHYAQIFASGKFQRYDHGSSGNLQKYGQETPPEYNLTKIEIPMAFFWGDVDTIGNPTDIGWLLDQK